MNKIEKLIEELCPDGVPVKQLGQVAEITKGMQVNRETLDEINPFPVYNGGIYPSGRHTESNFPAETITVSQGGASAGYINFVKEPLWVGAHCYAVIPGPEVSNRYLYFVMKTQQDNLQGKKYGAGIPALDKKTLSNLKVPVAPSPVQQEIVSILDKFTELEAELETEFELRTSQYDHYRGALIATLSSQSTRNAAFSEVAEIVRGASPRPIQKYITDSKDGINWIKIGDVDPKAKYITKTAQRITEEGVRHSRLIKPGDFVISNSMSFGRPYISRLAGCIHDGWLAITNYETQLNPDYLYHLLSSSFVQDEFRKRASNGTVSNLNAEIVRRVHLPIPPLDEQLEIARQLDSFEAILGDNTKGLPAEVTARRQQYEYYRNKLLSFKELKAS